MRPVADTRVFAGGYWIADGSLEMGESETHPVVMAVDRSCGWKTVAVPPDAFLEFVTDCHTEADVERLANRYGLLGTETVYDTVYLSNDETSTLAIAEPVSTWLDQAKKLRNLWEYWRALQDPTVDVQPRTFAQWRLGSFFLDEPLGVPIGPPEENRSPVNTKNSEAGPGHLPVRLQSGDDPHAVLREANTATQAHAEAIAAADRIETARYALDKLKRMAPSRRPDGYRSMRVAAAKALDDARQAERGARRQRDFTARQLGWTLLGLHVTKQLRLHGVAPTLVKSPLKTLARVRQSRQPTMALEHYAPHLLALLWLQLAIDPIRWTV